ncbi:DUF2125 domain-containing protein [Telmatospirillum sp.]|uniref:DUF2125 domain-containing protein n=1 Tax=Telmatospirillum sp. TaxID=2079197 RepID=UPI002850CF8A|nr:DUF2125 domain-containing protein [Telmatospirillum sp.]MDR3439176.1 DUF2125 domain-containing protein [Telmatospirillum sp.]
MRRLPAFFPSWSVGRKILAGTLLLLLLAAGYDVWWHQLAARLQSELDRWIAERQAAGWVVATGAVTVRGFPLRMEMTFEEPSIADPLGNRWQGPQLTATISPFAVGQSHLDAPGRHQLSIAGAAPVALTVDRLSGELSIGLNGVSQVAVDIGGLAVNQLHADHLAVTVRRLAAGPVTHADASWGVVTSMESVRFPEDPRLPFGPTLSSAHLEARLMGDMARGRPLDALTAWRDDGGTVEIDALTLDWPPLALTGKGTLALDGRMQPILASNCTVRGLFEAVDVLTRAGSVRAQDAAMVKLVLGLLMKPGPDGTQALTIPMTIQNRRLSVGPVALFEVPEISWH